MQADARSRFVRLSSAFVLGSVVAFAAVPWLARTSAIAGPRSVSGFAVNHGLRPLWLLAWNTFVVYGLGIALPLMLAWWLLMRRVPHDRMMSALALAIGALVALYVLVPVGFGEALLSPLGLPWWQHGLELSLLLVLGIELVLSRRAATGAHTAR